jgi:enamine deaminase RidA (YjgF/YER057c/UK114 family)
MTRKRVSSGTEWEATVGYSRAVRADGRVSVAGTTATDEGGEPVAPGDPYAQTAHALGLVADALDAAGASVADVVRTRVFVTDIDDWEAVGRAHGEMFGEVRPATTMVEVSSLIDPELVVEIEAEAVVDSGERSDG